MTIAIVSSHHSAHLACDLWQHLGQLLVEASHTVIQLANPRQAIKGSHVDIEGTIVASNSQAELVVEKKGSGAVTLNLRQSSTQPVLSLYSAVFEGFSVTQNWTLHTRQRSGEFQLFDVPSATFSATIFFHPFSALKKKHNGFQLKKMVPVKLQMDSRKHSQNRPISES